MPWHPHSLSNTQMSSAQSADTKTVWTPHSIVSTRSGGQHFWKPHQLVHTVMGLCGNFRTQLKSDSSPASRNETEWLRMKHGLESAKCFDDDKLMKSGLWWYICSRVWCFWASAAYTVVPMTLCTYWPLGCLCKETCKFNAGIVLWIWC